MDPCCSCTNKIQLNVSEKKRSKPAIDIVKN